MVHLLRFMNQVQSHLWNLPPIQQGRSLADPVISGTLLMYQGACRMPL
ncbi:hypothetical protein [Geothrix fuzhouensis]|nr:hypothetical protein [Geothrix fuzhouensis]